MTIDTPLDKTCIPEHVAIIMDGNGRWAKSRNKPRLFGHKAGVDALKKAIAFASENGIKYLSAWAFSTANWKRPESEVSGLMSILRATLKNDINDFHEKNIRLKVVGFLDELAPDLQDLIKAAEEKTKDNTRLTLIIQFNYDGQRDIVSAVNHLVDKGSKKITADQLAGALMMGDYPMPELMIRTSNVLRLSNYMLWQLAFTEFVFVEKNWPDFNEDDFLNALLQYQSIERRFGSI